MGYFTHFLLFLGDKIYRVMVRYKKIVSFKEI